CDVQRFQRRRQACEQGSVQVELQVPAQRADAVGGLTAQSDDAIQAVRVFGPYAQVQAQAAHAAVVELAQGLLGNGRGIDDGNATRRIGAQRRQRGEHGGVVGAVA